MNNILLIEDDLNHAKVLHRHLTLEGYLVVIRNTGKDGLQYITEANDIDLIILDINLPDISGLELLGSIKSVVNTPIIIYSGHSHYKQDFTTWLADEYIVKSPDLNILKSKIENLIKKL